MVPPLYDASLDLLARHGPADVRSAPFPHVVLRDVLDAAVVEQLQREFPASSVLADGKPLSSSERVSFPAHRIIGNAAISPLWQQFIATNSGEGFLRSVLGVFGPQIEAMHPALVARKPLGEWRAKLRDVEGEGDVAVDAQICINAPVTQTERIKEAHVDRRQVLFAGLFYLRDPHDTSAGGDLQIYRFPKGRPHGFATQYVKDRHVELVETVRYSSNTLVVFLNSIHSVHGVSVRGVTPHDRRFVNLVGEVDHHLFDWGPYQAPSVKAKAHARRYARRLAAAVR